MFDTARSLATLARWLGPWAGVHRAPENITTREESIEGLRVRRYQPRGAPRATILLAPGLHFLGADDPRLDRFCKILAAAGHLVIAPFIPGFLELKPGAGAIRDFEKIYNNIAKDNEQKLYIFSISFGSLLAFATAAAHPGELAGLIIFGGYAELPATLRFCLTGEVSSGRRAIRDPLNQPVVLSNLLEHIEPPAADPRALAAAWRRYVERTWGRPEMKEPARYLAVGEELARELPEAIRELFLIGVGARPGAVQLVESALARMGGAEGALDPSPYLPKVRGKVWLIHGADDDVIPFEQSHALAARLTGANVHTYITGLYGHTGASGALSSLRELKTLLQILRALAA